MIVCNKKVMSIDLIESNYNSCDCSSYIFCCGTVYYDPHMFISLCKCKCLMYFLKWNKLKLKYCKVYYYDRRKSEITTPKWNSFKLSFNCQQRRCWTNCFRQIVPCSWRNRKRTTGISRDRSFWKMSVSVDDRSRRLEPTSTTRVVMKTYMAEQDREDQVDQVDQAGDL